jgi:flavin-dependent dehydrogenase
VRYSSLSDNIDRSVRARFVVDASGRRGILHRKLALREESGHRISAAWWRFRGEYDVEKMVAPPNPRWSPKTQERRWFSTNHLMGRGYWVWMIPLSSKNTSIGIVADDDLHPFETYSSDARAREWLRQYEPRLAEFIAGAEVLDFNRLKHASYGARQVLSHERWSCVGVLPRRLLQPRVGLHRLHELDYHQARSIGAARRAHHDGRRHLQ